MTHRSGVPISAVRSKSKPSTLLYFDGLVAFCSVVSYDLNCVELAKITWPVRPVGLFCSAVFRSCYYRLSHRTPPPPRGVDRVRVLSGTPFTNRPCPIGIRAVFDSGGSQCPPVYSRYFTRTTAAALLPSFRLSRTTSSPQLTHHNCRNINRSLDERESGCLLTFPRLPPSKARAGMSRLQCEDG